MVQTRSQGRMERASISPRETSPQRDTTVHHGKKREAPESDTPQPNEESHSPKRIHNGNVNANEKVTKYEGDDFKDLLNQIVDKYGKPPLGPLIDDDWEPNEVVMVHILDALLSSVQISHDIASTTLSYLIEENYHQVETLRQASWVERTEVLKRGGYSHYREKTATFLGQLAELLEQKYDNDATKILPSDETGEQARATILERFKEIKGIGPVGVEIFLGSIQYFFPNVAPFLDQRSLQTAEELGLGQDTESMFAALGSEPLMMAKLENALTTVRLEKKENELRSELVAI